MRALRQCAAVAALLMLSAWPLRAQTSPVNDLLTRARGALDALRYQEAGTIAASLLHDFDAQLSPLQRAEALQVVAAALYPDPASGAAQQRDSALRVLQRLVKLAPAADSLRRDLSWAGLDTVYALARRTTLAGDIRLSGRVVVRGLPAVLPIDVYATVPARVSAELIPPRGAAPVSIDTIGPVTAGTARVRLGDNEHPVGAGEYVLRVVLRDSTRTDSVVVWRHLAVEAPPIRFDPVPVALDSSQLKPVRSEPARNRGLIAAALVGGGAILAASLKGPAPLGSESIDGRGVAIGSGLALAAVIGALLDHGQPIPANVADNAALARAFEASVQTARAENQRRREGYQMTITVTAEQR